MQFKTIICNVEKLKVEHIIIKRIHKRKDCTLSVLFYKNLIFKLLGLPDLNNQKNISCIQNGIYHAFKRMSPGKGYEVIEFLNVPNRTYIQLHHGIYTRHILGCELPGEEFIDLDGDGIPDITGTERTLKTLLAALPDRFMIEVL